MAVASAAVGAGFFFGAAAVEEFVAAGAGVLFEPNFRGPKADEDGELDNDADD